MESIRPVGLEVPPAPVRYDIALGGSINIGDGLAINPVFGRVCATPP